MTIRNTLLIILLFLSNLLRASNPADALLFHSGTVNATNNVNEFISETISLDEITDGYYYRIIQFKDFPSEKQKKDIISSGIILNSYIPYHAYNCAIPAGFDKNNLVQLNVFSILNWDMKIKVKNDLTGTDFPLHTIIEKGKTDIVVHYQQNISEERAKQLFEKNHLNVIRSIQANHTVVLRIPFDRFKDVVNLPFVYYIEPIAIPSVKDDTEGRSLHRSNVINADYATGRHYDGSGVVVGLADDGEIGPHIDFTGRVTQHLSGLGGSHGDMTSGICVGAGNLVARIRGMGTGAYLHVFDIGSYPQIIDAVSNYNNYGIVITSTSYAQTCNQYNADSELGDLLIHQNKQFEFCFSAGNEGTTNCNYGAGNLWGNITGGYKLGKNVIAVGNLDATDILENSSSRGPAIDGRIKPEICSNGIDQRSTNANNTYQVGGGTSAACPGVAGTLSQLYQAYKELTGAPNPPSGLIKACVLNSAEDLGNPGPDFKHGWGRINAFRAVTTLEENRYISDSVAQTQSNSYSLNVPANVKQLRVMIYWHDKEGSPVSAKALVNDLNLTIEDPAFTQFKPWVLDPTPTTTALNTPAIRGVDSLNNMEQVTIDNPLSGMYSLFVDGFQVPFQKQEYFIVYEFRTDSIKVTFPNGGEGFVPGETEIIRWDAFDTAGTFDIRYSLNNGSSWTNLITGLPGSERFYNWHIPNFVSDSALVEVSRNGFSDVNDTFYTIIGVPGGFHVAFACPDSIGLAWNPVANASGYDVSMLGSKYMDFAGTTTATNFTITGTSPLSDYWFSVKALGPNGGKGMRANAINHSGLLNCTLGLDGGIINILKPESEFYTSCMNLTNHTVMVEIQNTGITSISGFSMNYSLNGSPVVSEPFIGTVLPGNTANFTFSQNLSIPGTGNFVLKIWMSLTGDQNAYNDTIKFDIKVVPGTTFTLPQTENFDAMSNCQITSDCEVTLCTLSNGWINGENGLLDDIDWRVNNATTPTTNSGPDVDHTTGGTSGKYIYLEASACNNNEAVLISPCYDLNGITNPVLTFWYHMYGVDMGALHVDIIGQNQTFNDIIPVRSGDQGNSWKLDSVNLNQFIGQTINVRFRGITGIDSRSDMALDDIGILDQTIGITETSATIDFSIFPNPGSGIFYFNTGRSIGSRQNIIVRDVLGKIIFEKELSGNTTNQNGVINLSEFTKGVYTVTFQSDNFSRQIKLLLIN